MLAILLAACGGTDEPMEPPMAVIGAGEQAFAPLSDGAVAPVILGPQGGYHIIGSVRIAGIEPGDPGNLADPDNPTTVFTVERGGTKIDSGGASYTQGLDPAEGGQHEMVGRIVILDITSDAELDGETLRFVVTVTDSSGRTATDEVSVVARPDPRNP